MQDPNTPPTPLPEQATTFTNVFDQGRPASKCTKCGGLVFSFQEVMNHKCPTEGANVPATDKPLLRGLTRDNPETPEGKYLVKRRDGTVVEWPSFVLGARDPFAEIALIAYANAVWAQIHANKARKAAGHEVDPRTEVTPEFATAIHRLANLFKKYRQDHGVGDPGRGKHRKDDPATVEEMKKGYSA